MAHSISESTERKHDMRGKISKMKIEIRDLVMIIRNVKFKEKWNIVIVEELHPGNNKVKLRAGKSYYERLSIHIFFS